MCCLFGMIDYKNSLTTSQRNHVIATLAKECEVRGIDATGIAYNHDGYLRIFKRPLPARKMWWKLKHDSAIVIGHTRMTTQGNEKFNRNNHPFRGKIDSEHFALAHNGMLYNDLTLRRKFNLPKTDIETDSYIAVQLIEKSGEVSFKSLADMAEQLEGSYTITVLDEQDNLYFIKRSNPMCIYHWKDRGLYIYASTEEILQAALKKISINFGKFVKIPLDEGEIMRIDTDGTRTCAKFEMKYCSPFIHDLWYPYACDDHYVENLKAVSQNFGYTAEDIDELIESGVMLEEIEDWFYYCAEEV